MLTTTLQSTGGRWSSSSLMYADNLKGFVLAVVSSAFIGASFIVKKKGLKRAGASGARAGVGGYGYLMEPLWWVGLFAMIIGEIANFVAYIFAPAVMVTPLGALSIIVSAVLAHFLLKEKLQKMGMLGCVLCIVGSTVIVLHAPEEKTPTSIDEIWDLATQPAFLLYTTSAITISLVLMLHCSPRYGQANIMIYLGICSIIGSLTVMSVKAVGIAIKLTLDGVNQASYFQTWIFAMVAVTCIIIQLNYLNKALDSFNTAVVSPIYYAMFTVLTILASAIMFKDLYGQSASDIASEVCGLITVLSGTTVLHSTREPDPPPNSDHGDLYSPLSTKISWSIQGNGELAKHNDDDLFSTEFITILRQDYFA
ncbi:putative Non-imprinted in Prader-Willi/Angelman syndrome region protein,putative [Zostera marina]|uniref:Probable magnesium transporter n=1 Tax=Zostera marina TaxID=29655 RepID=A0A0K9NNG4_ZOSMR|nr:putative Non-imprinted in Prader-Willi/Angelman syndrome region protein,putative [Zostera marina]